MRTRATFAIGVGNWQDDFVYVCVCIYIYIYAVLIQSCFYSGHKEHWGSGGIINI
jgi:hypothetical protein